MLDFQNGLASWEEKPPFLSLDLLTIYNSGPQPMMAFPWNFSTFLLLLAQTRHFRVLAATVLQLTNAQLLNRQLIKFRDALLQSALSRFVLQLTFRLLRNEDLPFGWKTLCLSTLFLEADFRMNSNYCQNPKSTVRVLHVIWKGYPNFQRWEIFLFSWIHYVLCGGY